MAALIAARRAQDGIPHAVSCRALGVSRSWFYKHKDGQLPPRAQRRERLKAEVARLFAVHDGKYGSPRITADLREAGWRVSENTVAALMASSTWRPGGRRSARAPPGREGPLAGTGPGQAGLPRQRSSTRKWYGDGTEIPTGEGKLHLASVMDMASRRILGFALGEHHDAQLAYGALAMAVAVRGGQVPGVILHTDQGSEYTAGPSARPAGGWASASRWAGPARPWTTRSSSPGTPPWSSSCAPVEHFATRAQARARVAAWIEDYNRHRRHSALAMMSPVNYEKTLQAGEAA